MIFTWELSDLDSSNKWGLMAKNRSEIVIISGITTTQAAEYLGYSEHTLRSGRSRGQLCGVNAPDFVRLGTRSIRYTKESLDNWIVAAKAVGNEIAK